MAGFPSLRFRWWVLGLAAWAGLAVAHAGKNLLFISVDDLSWVRLGIYGHGIIKTPNLDALGRESLVFDRMYTQVPQCSQSRSSIFTGIRPETSGLWQLHHDWRAALPGAVSLQRHLLNHGYRFEEVGKVFDYRSGGVDYPRDPRFAHGNHHTADVPIEKLRSLAEGGRPFALVVGFGEPHPVHWDTPEKAARYQAFIDQYDAAGLPLEGPVPWDQGFPAGTRQALATVYGVISFMDHQVGALVKAAKELGVWDNTVVVFFAADHGSRLGEPGGDGRWGKLYPDELSAHVPCIIRVPGSVGNGRRTKGIVEGVDMYPTLIELLGLGRPPQNLQGISFAPLFGDPDRSWKEAAFTAYQGGELRSIVTAGYRLIQGPGGVELYDLARDPKGVVNVAARHPDTVSRLLAKLDAGPGGLRAPITAHIVPGKMGTARGLGPASRREGEALFPLRFTDDPGSRTFRPDGRVTDIGSGKR